MRKSKKIQIVLPPRLGDSILCLPALYTFRKLINKNKQQNYEVQLFCSKNTYCVLNKLNIFPLKVLNWQSKLKSWFKRAENTVFFNNSSDILGLYAGISMGEKLNSRFYAQYNIDIQSLSIDKVTDLLPNELFNGLDNLSLASKRYFGFLLNLGFSTSQIIQAFQESKNWLIPVFDKSINIPERKYITVCLEAANNKQKNINRIWSKELFFKLITKIYEIYGLEIVLLGISKEKIENIQDYIHDKRGNLSLKEVSYIINNSQFYIGNDSGLLHLANLLGKRTIGIYTITSPEFYNPIRANLNIPIQSPQDENTVLESIKNNFSFLIE